MALRLLVACLLAALTACTWEPNEPGLFPEPRPRSTVSFAPMPELPPAATNPRLPVAGESVWTTSEGLDVTVRIAVHAVRRSEGATVLDWSVTPLSAPGAAFGEDLPRSVELGLVDEAQSNVTIVLLDPARGVAYRPLSHRSRQVFNHCLCIPVWLAQQSLRIGETVLLQVAYPMLPESLREVDVAFSTVAPVFGVPVTPVGQVPTALSPVDLARPAPAPRPGPREIRFGTRSPDRRQSIQLERVVRGPRLTALEWTIRSLNDQTGDRGSPYGEPISATPPPDVLALGYRVASGPQLRPGRGAAPRDALWMTAEINGQEWLECLCTSLGLWAPAVVRAGGSARVVTLYAEVPARGDRIDVVLPGLTTTSAPVVAAVLAATRLGPPVRRDLGRWTYTENPPLPWSTQDWPTPLPDIGQLADYVPAVESVQTLAER